MLLFLTNAFTFVSIRACLNVGAKAKMGRLQPDPKNLDKLLSY